MAKTQAYISIGPSELVVALVKASKTVKTVRRPLVSAEWSDHWGARLVSLDRDFAQAITEAGIASGSVAHLMYDSPDARADLIETPVSGDGAIRAAKLAFGEGLPFSLASNAHDAAVVPGIGDSTMVLCAGDRDEHLAIVCEWLRRAGLRVGRVAPRVAFVIPMLGASQCEGDRPTAWIHIGRHETVMLGRVGGSIKFVRSVSLGWGQLADSARSACVSAGKEPGPGEIEHALQTRGLPGRNDTWPVAGGVQGYSLLPALQPVLQRLGVEIRQTLRFGFGSQASVRASVMLTGDGGAIGGIAELLSGQIELDVRSDSGGDEFEAFVSGEPLVNLLPAVFVENRRKKSMGRGLRIGAAAAAAVLAGETALTYLHATQTEAELERAQTRLELARVEDARFGTAVALAERVNAAEMTMRSSLSGDVPWALVFEQLSDATDEAVRLRDVRFSVAGASPTLTVTGYAFGDETEGPERLSAYLQRVAGLESVARVQSGSTRMSAFNGRTAVSFEASIDLVALPSVLVAVADAGGAP